MWKIFIIFIIALASSNAANLFCSTAAQCPSNLVCVNNLCVDTCKQNENDACGINTECFIVNHRVTCKCLKGLIGDPLVGCKQLLTPCAYDSNCDSHETCYGNLCKTKCSHNNNCLSFEKCLKGVCQEFCSSDSQCESGYICKNRQCEIGCRSNAACDNDKICVLGSCRNPCLERDVCGINALCKVEKHQISCVCPPNFAGNPKTMCLEARTLAMTTTKI